MIVEALYPKAMRNSIAVLPKVFVEELKARRNEKGQFTEIPPENNLQPFTQKELAAMSCTDMRKLALQKVLWALLDLNQ